MSNEQSQSSLIGDSFINISTMMLETDEYYEPTKEIELKDIESSNTWSKENTCCETIIIEKNTYDKILHELSFSKIQIDNYKGNETQYKKMIDDYDRTLKYFLEKDNKELSLLDDMKRNNGIDLMNEINRLKSSEDRLKTHIKALKKDLFDSEERADAFKQIAREKIGLLTQEIEKYRELLKNEERRNEQLKDKISNLEGIIERRVEENVELIEYCKYLLK